MLVGREMASDLTTLRALDDLLVTDSFIARYRIRNEITGEVRPYGLADHYANFKVLTLEVIVPEEVAIAWTEAQHLAIYGYFCRTFLALSHQQALIALELALRLRLPVPKRQGLRAYLDLAEGYGLIDKEALLARNRRPDVVLDPDGTLPYTAESYWPVLRDSLTGLRNAYAHGMGGRWPDWGVGMEIARRIIKQVYSKPAPADAT